MRRAEIFDPPLGVRYGVYSKVRFTGFENQNYVCPCHGSRYNLNGGVVQGPAPAALRQFASDVANDVLTIHT